MNTTNIILWTVSITLSIFSISFAAFAAYSSSKANRRLKDTISAEWTTNEAMRLFFEQQKNIKDFNDKTLKKLQTQLSYKSYGTYASKTRMTLITKGSKRILTESDYSDLLKKYVEYKNELDLDFKTIIDFKQLDQNIKIDLNTKKTLIKYHNKIKKYNKEIITEFVKLNGDING